MRAGVRKLEPRKICLWYRHFRLYKNSQYFMNPKDNELLKARVRQWQVAAPVMQGVRDCDIQNADTARALAFFRGAAIAALPKNPPLPWSGLVEQQQWFSKLRKP